MKNKSIQILRGISIIYILILHSTFIWPKNFKDIYFKYFDTASGVELFFCIAGYFLASKILIHKFELYDYITLLLKKIKRLSPSIYMWGV